MKNPYLKFAVVFVFLYLLLLAYVNLKKHDEVLHGLTVIKLKYSFKTLLKPEDINANQRLADLNEVIGKTNLFLDQHPLPSVEIFNCELIKNDTLEIEIELKEECLHSVFTNAEFSYTKKRGTARFILGVLLFALVPLSRWLFF